MYIKDIRNIYKDCNKFDYAFIRIATSLVPYEKIADSVQLKKGSLLDIGCGHGIFSNAVSLKNPDLQVCGCDIDRSKIIKALKTVGERYNIVFRHENALDVMAGNKYDVIVFLAVLYLIPYKEQEHLIRAAVDTLNPHGKLMVIEFDDKPRWKYLLGYLQERLMVSLYTKGAGLYYRSAEEYSTLMRDLGLNNISVNSLNMLYHPSVLIEAQRNDQ